MSWYDDLLPSPGILSGAGNDIDPSQDSPLPQDNPPILVPLPNLTPSYSAILPTTMITDTTGILDDSSDWNDWSTSTLFGSGTGATDSIINALVGSSKALLGAFVINPQLVATAEGQAQTQANLQNQGLLTQAAISQNTLNTILQWGLIGLVIFLIFSFVTKK